MLHSFGKKDTVTEDRGSFIYRCRNCNRKHTPASYPDAMDAAINSVLTGEGMLSVHHCLNGNIGISDLIAVTTTDVEKHKMMAKMTR